MKFQTMQDLRLRSTIILKASDAGFDFPEMSEALEVTKDRLVDEDLGTIESELKMIIDELEGQDLLDLITVIINTLKGQDLVDLINFLLRSHIDGFELKGQEAPTLEWPILGDLIDWLFEKGNIRNTDAFFESVLAFYDMRAAMYLDAMYLDEMPDQPS